MSALLRDRGVIKQFIPAIVIFFAIFASLPGIGRGAINEGFDGFQTGTRPAGWTFIGCNADTDTYTSVGDYYPSSPAIRLRENTYYIQTETFFHQSDLRFWVKGMGTDASSTLLVEEYYSGASWSTVTSVWNLQTVAGIYFDPIKLNFDATIARFTFVTGVGDIAFDYVNTTDAAPTPTPSVTPSRTPTTPTPTITLPPTATPTPNTDFCNPSFEEIPDDPIPGWTKVADMQNYVAVTEDQAKEGIRSCSLSATGTVTYKYTDAGIRSCTVPVIGGDIYIISGWFFVDDEGSGLPITNSQFKFNIEWLDSLGVVISTDSDVDWSLTAFNSWEKREYTETAPSAAVDVQIYIATREVANANNDVYIDVFSLKHAPTYDVLTPAEGAIWYIGETEDITWDSIDITGNVDVAFSTDSGWNWTPIVINIPDTGTQSWTIPTEPSSECLVHVRQTGGGGVYGYSGLFTIAERDTIHVTSPAGGETWYRTVEYDIAWSYGPEVGSGCVDLDYSVDNGSSWTSITSCIAIDSSPYTWTVPSENSSNCLVRVCQPSTSTCGQSPNVFTITTPTFTNISPGDGETLYFPDIETITWNSTSGITGNVNIDYSTDGLSGPWAEIASNQFNSGFCSWTIPDDSSNTCRVRISEIGGISDPGISADDFTIIGVPIAQPYRKLAWQQMNQISTDCSTSYVIEAYDNNNIWVAGSCGNMFFWDGLAWQLQVELGANMKDISAVANDDVWTGGSGGYIYHYDGIWWSKSISMEKTVYTLDSLDSDHIMAGSSEAKVSFYTPGGGWTTHEATAAGSIKDCAYLRPNRAYAVTKKTDTNYGKLLYSSDPDWNNWTEVINLATWGLDDFPMDACIGEDGNTHLWIAGDCGAILYYNSASGWNWQTDVGNTNWDCVEVLDEKNVWVAGGGCIMHFNGSEWIVEEDDISGIKCISAVDNTHVYALGGSWKIYHTSALPTATLTPVGHKTATPTPVPSATPYGYKTPTPTPVSPICNNSFEESPDLTCWWKYGTASSIEKSSAQHYDGSYSCLFEKPTTAFSGRGVYSEEIPIIGGEKYIFSGWYFVDYLAGSIVDTQIQFEIWWSEGGTRLYSDDVTHAFTLSAFNIWEEKVFNATAPANADEVEIYISCKETVNNDNEVFIDFFNLDRPPGITVTAPAVGAVWYVGTSETITWDSVSISKNIDIHYSVNNGANWIEVATNIADSGTYTWNPIPNNTSSQCLVRVRENGGGASDESGQFMIAAANTINILAPQGGETWYQTGLYDIKWSAGPAVGGGTVNLDYSTDNGSSWDSIAPGVAVGSSPYPWTIPAEDSNNCLVRVRQPSTGISGQSPAVFTITPPTFIVTSPAGGEYWYYGASRTITWASTQGITGNVNIDYSTDGPSGPWSQIAFNQPNSGSYFSWTIPNINSSSCRVRISSAEGIGEPGISAANFTLRGTSPPAAYRPLIWTVMNQIDTSCSLYTIEAWDENNIWVGGSCGVIFYWNGSVWVMQDELSNIATFKALAADDVWAGGLGGGIYHYDGAWSHKYSAPRDVKSIDACDPNHVMASCYKSQSMWMSSYTSAGGWSSEHFGSGSARNVVYLKPNLAYVCSGTGGGIYKSVDRFSWDYVWYHGYGMNKNPFDGCLDQNGNPQLWVVGDCGFISHYDGGTDTWSIQTRVVVGDGWPNFECVEVLDEHNVWAAGGGKVYHYNGSKWIVENEKISTFYTISVVNNGLAYAVGSTGSQKIYIGRAVPTLTPWHQTTPTPYGFETPSPTPVPVAGPISGRVYDRVMGNGINNLYIRALPAESGLRPGTAKTDSNGNYTTTVLDAGLYYLFADSNQGSGVRLYRSQWYNQKDTQSTASSVSSNSSGKDFPLYKSGVYPTPPPTPTPDFQMIMVEHGDYDGDGFSDIAIYRGVSGLWAVRAVTRLYFGISDDIPVSGDYDGDGTADIAIFRSSSGLWVIRNVSRIYFGGSADQPIPGDYDGDGGCDIGVFRNSSGLWAIKDVSRSYFGGSSDQPVVGDYDGDGVDDIAIFRKSTGLWALKDISRFYYGMASDIAVPGDYSGIGTTLPAIYRPLSGLWSIRNISRVYFGGGIDQPVPTGFTGADDIGIFRPSTGLWAIRGITRAYFGTLGDVPATR